MAKQGYNEAQGRNFYQQFVDSVEAMPGVHGVTLAQYIPVNAGGSRTGVYIEGYTAQPDEDLELNLNVVGANYFQALGIPLLAGRAFAESDTASSAKVVMINEAFARRFWPGESVQEAVGKRFSTSGARGRFMKSSA